ncbi:hypothetical protein Q7C36_011012 [Tachysurus vachellii]|uniref:Uncharacterized protein n=1 Tax=Tachysurus vachellii TaxID=175792 RepID=A0AA88N1U4_TACVA|nr:hypothetical protein Q7C36_011012 [Tachysurus vachellii]
MALPVGFVTTAGCQTVLARVRYCAISVDFKVEVGGQSGEEGELECGGFHSNDFLFPVMSSWEERGT